MLLQRHRGTPLCRPAQRRTADSARVLRTPVKTCSTKFGLMLIAAAARIVLLFCKHNQLNGLEDPDSRVRATPLTASGVWYLDDGSAGLPPVIL